MIFDETDDLVTVICRKEREDVQRVEYTTHRHVVRDGQTCLVTDADEEVPVQVFGEHNMRNLNGARAILSKIGIGDRRFYEAIRTFKGAARRLEVVGQNQNTIVYRDFAHAPSKLEATTRAVKKQFTDRKLVACLELHTFSSLNKEFLKQYKGSFEDADTAIVYFNPHTIAHKKLEPISPEDVKNAFRRKDLMVFTDHLELGQYLTSQQWSAKNLLLMSSGTFNGTDLKALSQKILGPVASVS